jgi:hypothetical protein
MGGNVRGHPHGDAGGAVQKEFRNPGGQDRRLIQGFVVIGYKIDGVLFQVRQQLLGDP